MSPLLDSITSSNHRKGRLSQADYLHIRMELLEPKDRIWLELHFCHNVSYSHISRLCGLSARTVSRRINDQVQRLLSDEYINIVRKQKFFSRQELDVAYDYFLLGKGYRSIAVKRGLSATAARKIVERLGELSDKRENK